MRIAKILLFLSVLLGLFAATAHAAPAKLMQAQATAGFRAAGTSFTQVNAASVNGAITLERAGGGALKITGGTETGHASGTFTSIGGNKWKAGSGNIYYRESNHWDVTFHHCGGC